MKAKLIWVAGTALLCALLGPVRAADVSIRVDASAVAAKRVHTELTLAVKPGPLTLVYPKWIPGEHGPTGPLNSMIGLDIRANGQRLTWTRDPYEMYAIRLTVPRGVDRVEVSMDTGLATEDGDFTAGPSNSAALAVISWNQFLVFPKGIDADRVSVEASIVPPAGWTIVCALDYTLGNGSVYSLESASLARLIDSPVQMGKYSKIFDLSGSPPGSQIKHKLSIMADSAQALVVPDDFAAGYGRLVAESGALFGSRIYRHYTWLLSLSDHVAHFGLEHHESSDDRTDEDALSEEDLRMEVAGLLGHEYVHSWNGKYRRPLGLLSPDYQRAMDGTLLWVYEGMTEFWGNVLPTRAGIISPDFFRETVAEAAGFFDTEPGARWRPMVDTATSVSLLNDAPAAWTSSRRSVDYYDASIFLWLDVDSELRARTNGRSTIDDYVKRFYAGQTGEPSVKPYVEQDIYDALGAVAPADWRSLIHRHLDELDTSALLGALSRSGWKLAYSAEPNAAVATRDKRREETNRRWSIGLSIDKQAKIIDVVSDRAAALAGASPGMSLIAVNGRKYTAKVLDAAIAEAKTTHRPIVLLVENADYYTSLNVAYYDGPRYPHLVRIDGQPDTLSNVIAARVK
jgi:predicted metalloprotease with PDZ domain